ncbi:MAG TPA: DUF2231 domain-containing protein [Methylophilaceae bacterium]|nr:DUF2231 domain-containing protein [Methylophilaceae bacterium]
MRTPASIGSHPIHPMLITIPVGLLIFSLICDLIALFAENPDVWLVVAFFTMVGGFIGALIAAVPGVIDLMAIENEKVKKIGMMHMALNLVAVTLYAVNIWLRIEGTSSSTPLILSVIAVGLLGASGWLGAEMVHKHGVGVDTSTAK